MDNNMLRSQLDDNAGMKEHVSRLEVNNSMLRSQLEGINTRTRGVAQVPATYCWVADAAGLLMLLGCAYSC